MAAVNTWLLKRIMLVSLRRFVFRVSTRTGKLFNGELDSLFSIFNSSLPKLFSIPQSPFRQR